MDNYINKIISLNMESFRTYIKGRKDFEGTNTIEITFEISGDNSKDSYNRYFLKVKNNETGVEAQDTRLIASEHKVSYETLKAIASRVFESDMKFKFTIK